MTNSKDTSDPWCPTQKSSFRTGIITSAATKYPHCTAPKLKLSTVHNRCWTMRLPFSLRKVPEPSDSSSRRSSITEDTSKDQATETIPDDLSEYSTVQSNSTPIDTPATSFSSYNSVYDREARKTGMYKLSGKNHPDLIAGTLC